MGDKQTQQKLKDQITELKKQNEILRSHTSIQNKDDSTKYNQTIFNNMGDAVCLKNEQSEMILVNDAFCEMLKLSRTEIIGKTLAENIDPNELEKFLKIDKKVLLDGIENINEESLTIAGGETLEISTRKSRFIDFSGRKFIVCAIRDITNIKKAELALKESETRFRKLNTTKDKLISIIAHDLRSPFGNIISLSDLLIDDIKDNNFAESEKFINIINSLAKSSLILLDNLLNWAKSQTGELYFRPEKITLSKVVLEILELEESLAEAKNIDLQYTATDETELYTDKNILKTVIRNLISNAIKFTNKGGAINVLTTTNNDLLEVSVSDNGVGMNEETIHKLFDIATNATLLGTANEKGSGLGLVLCKEFVKKLNGNIWVESEEGKGSNFKFTLPLSVSE